MFALQLTSFVFAMVRPGLHLGLRSFFRWVACICLVQSALSNAADQQSHYFQGLWYIAGWQMWVDDACIVLRHRKTAREALLLIGVAELNRLLQQQ